MANPISGSNQHNKKLHAVLGLFCLALFMQKVGANEFTVGGSNGWTVPSTDPNSLHYNQWAEKTRFQIGDSLVFVYSPERDSVLHVTHEAYTNCNTESYIEKLCDKHTVFKLNQSGPFYFISGNKDNCLKNEKMVVIVLAGRSNLNRTSQPSPSPSPSPSGSMDIIPPSPAPSPSAEKVEISPTPAPVSESSPPPTGSIDIIPSSPPPASEESPPPAPGEGEMNPSPAPVSETTPPSRASAIVMSFKGCIGAFVASSILLGF